MCLISLCNSYHTIIKGIHSFVYLFIPKKKLHGAWRVLCPYGNNSHIYKICYECRCMCKTWITNFVQDTSSLYNYIWNTVTWNVINYVNVKFFGVLDYSLNFFHISKLGLLQLHPLMSRTAYLLKICIYIRGKN